MRNARNSRMVRLGALCAVVCAAGVSLCYANGAPLTVEMFPLNPFERKLDGQWQASIAASDGKVYFGSSSHSHDAAARLFQYDPVAGLNAVKAQAGAAHHAPDAGSVDYHSVQGGPLDNLGVARDHLNGRLLRSPAGRGQHAPQERNLQAFRKDKRQAQRRRNRPGNRQVVDSAAHGQLAYVAAGKLQRLDHVAVRRKGKGRRLHSGEGQTGRVA